MNTVAEDIKDVLVDAGHGSFAATTGWGIYLHTEPSKPDNVITLYDTSTETWPTASTTPPPAEDVMLQVRVRGTTFTEVETKVKQLIALLHNHASWTVDGEDSSGEDDMEYQGIFRRSGPFILPRDDQDRAITTINFAVLRETVR